MSTNTSTPKKPPVSGRLTPTGTNARSNGNATASPRSSAKPTSTVAASSAAASSTPAGHQRTRSLRNTNGTPISARAAVKKPGVSAANSGDEASRAEASSLMDDLRERLQKAEQQLDDAKRQTEALQARLDDSQKEQAQQEERIHEDEERLEELENEKKEVTKQKRELETIYEAERAAVMKDRESTNAREEELQSIIQRLKDSLSQKESAKGSGDVESGQPSPTLDANHFAPPLTRSNSFRNNSKILLQKDKVIEELRLETAEMQIKLMELENKGGGRTQDLEKALMEARVTNARLMEENESFQSLLMEKTLNGGFSSKNNANGHDRATSSDSGHGASLADELASVAEEDEGDDARTRRLEVEVERQKAENKALTLYINKIIERILQHQGGFETILSHNDDEVGASSTKANIDKDLPPPPSSKDGDEPQVGFLQRVQSMASGAIATKPRPQSVMMPPRTVPSVTENINTAPSIPLDRKASQRHSMALPRRVQTDSFNPGAASIVSNMTRGDSDTTPTHTTSPGINSPRASYFFNRMPSSSSNIPRVTPGSDAAPAERRPSSSATSSTDGAEHARRAALDALNGDASSDTAGGVDGGIDTPSPPRSITSSKAEERQVFSGNKPRPLRLLKEEDKKNNRNSWIPNAVGNWFNNAAATKEGVTTAQNGQPQQPPTSAPGSSHGLTGSPIP